MDDIRDDFAIILNNMPTGVTVQAPDGHLLYANDTAAKLSGYLSAQAMLATPIAQHIERYERYDEAGQLLSVDQLPGRLA
jgi:PAS domain-containing protein